MSCTSDTTLSQVLLSCIQQAVILMAIWVVLSAADWLRWTIRKYGHKARVPTTQRLAAFSRPGRQTAALVAALQELQKTQAFFMLALQIACLLALDNAKWLQAPTFQQMYVNGIVILMLSAAGIYPIVIGLITLRKCKGRLEWFTLVASLACIGVSSFTWYKAASLRIDRSQLQQSGFNPPECAGINPAQYCEVPMDETISSRLSRRYPVFLQRLSIGPICAAVCLAAERILPFAVWYQSMAIPRWSKTILRISALVCTEAWVLWGNIEVCLFFVLLWQDVYAENRVWTIGQIIGVGVWLPVFIEWLYLALRKFCVSCTGGDKAQREVTTDYHDRGHRSQLQYSPAAKL